MSHETSPFLTNPSTSLSLFPFLLLSFASPFFIFLYSNPTFFLPSSSYCLEPKLLPFYPLRLLSSFFAFSAPLLLTTSVSQLPPFSLAFSIPPVSSSLLLLFPFISLLFLSPYPSPPTLVMATWALPRVSGKCLLMKVVTASSPLSATSFESFNDRHYLVVFHNVFPPSPSPFSLSSLPRGSTSASA